MAVLNKKEIIEKYALKKGDTGSSEVQVALATARILDLAEHMKRHKKDKHSQRGLLALVSERKKMLAYLQRKDAERYKALIAALGLRK